VCVLSGIPPGARHGEGGGGGGGRDRPDVGWLAVTDTGGRDRERGHPPRPAWNWNEGTGGAPDFLFFVNGQCQSRVGRVRITVSRRREASVDRGMPRVPAETATGPGRDLNGVRETPGSFAELRSGTCRKASA